MSGKGQSKWEGRPDEAFKRINTVANLRELADVGILKQVGVDRGDIEWEFTDQFSQLADKLGDKMEEKEFVVKLVSVIRDAGSVENFLEQFDESQEEDK